MGRVFKPLQSGGIQVNSFSDSIGAPFYREAQGEGFIQAKAQDYTQEASINLKADLGLS